MPRARRSGPISLLCSWRAYSCTRGSLITAAPHDHRLSTESCTQSYHPLAPTHSHCLSFPGGAFLTNYLPAPKVSFQPTKMLIQKGAMVNLLNANGCTPLHACVIMAAANQPERVASLPIARALLDGGARPNLPDADRLTPTGILLAAESGVKNDGSGDGDGSDGDRQSGGSNMVLSGGDSCSPIPPMQDMNDSCKVTTRFEKHSSSRRSCRPCPLYLSARLLDKPLSGRRYGQH
jgi:hypothetical protein